MNVVFRCNLVFVLWFLVSVVNLHQIFSDVASSLAGLEMLLAR